MKRRFPVFSVGIRTQPKTALATIVATAVLFNKLHKDNDEMSQNDTVENPFLEEIPAIPIPPSRKCSK